MQWIFSEKNTLCLFSHILSKCSIPLINNMTVSCTSTRRPIRVQRFYVTVGMKYHIITVKSYSSTDPVWSSSSRSSRLVTKREDLDDDALVNSLPHLISPWHAQKNVHDKWALTQPQRAVWQGLSELHPQRNNPRIYGGAIVGHQMVVLGE